MHSSMHARSRSGSHNPSTHPNHDMDGDGLDAWLTNGHQTQGNGQYSSETACYLPEFGDVSYTHSFLDPLGSQQPVKNDIYMHNSSAVPMHGLSMSAGANYSAHGPAAIITDEPSHSFSMISPGSSSAQHFDLSHHSMSLGLMDSSSVGAASSSAVGSHHFADASLSKPIGHIGALAPQDPTAMYSQQQWQQQPAKLTQVKQENGNSQAHQPIYGTRSSQRQQQQHNSEIPTQRRSSTHSGDMDDSMPGHGDALSDHHSIASEDSSAMSSAPDVPLQQVGGSSGHSSDHTSTHTSPLVSSPDHQPLTPPMNGGQQDSPVPSQRTLQNGQRLPRGASSKNQTSSGASSLAGGAENINCNSNNGLVSTLQSATDVLLNVNLFSGTGKKKTWPSRAISLQSLHNPSLSYGQLLFHAANISTFLSVQVEGRDIHGAVPQGGAGAQQGHAVTVQDCSAVKQRIEALRAYAHQNGNGSRENSGSSHESHRSSQRSSRSTPTAYTASGGLDLPPIEVTFHLAENVKSCTRLGCLNLLVNKSNRRACNICQSHGAEINPNLLRRLVINPHHSAAQYAYLEQILEDFAYWKFDSVDDHNGSGAGASVGGHAFPFCNQVGWYIAFIDSHTAAHVQRDFNQKIGASSANGTSSASPLPLQHARNGSTGLANGNGFITNGASANGANGTNSPLTTAICEVDPNYHYAIKMKSHFWMLEVKPKPNALGSPTPQKVKSKFYKKVGKQPHKGQTAAAAAAAMAAQQAAANGYGDNPGGDALMPYNARNNALGHKRRFDESDGPVANMVAVNHINHISINMPMPNGSQPMNAKSSSGGAMVELMEDDDQPAKPSNTVHVSDTSFSVMKNRPVPALLNVHDSSEQPASSSSATASDGAASTETIDSKPLVGAPTPVVLVYRDMDAYQRDALFNGSVNGPGSGNGSSGNNGGNSSYNNGDGYNGGNNNNNGGGNNNNGPSAKRSRFDSNNHGGNGFANQTFSMATVATPVLGVNMPGAMGVGAMGGLNTAAMAGVAAAMNQFQLAQVAQAQMQQAQVYQQVMDYGRFPAPWVFNDRAAAGGVKPSVDNANAPARSGDVEMQNLKQTKHGKSRERDQDGNSTFDDDAKEEDTLDSQSAGSRSVVDTQSHNSDEVSDNVIRFRGDDGNDAHDPALDFGPDFAQAKDIRVRVGSDGEEVEDEEDDVYSFDPDDEGRIKTPRKSPLLRKNNPLAMESHQQRFRSNDQVVEQLLLIEDESGGVRKGTKPMKTVTVEPATPVYQAFSGRGPAADFFHSFQFFQQSFWGMLSTLLFGLVAIIILVYNVHLPDDGDRTANALQLLRWGPSNADGTAAPGSGKMQRDANPHPFSHALAGPGESLPHHPRRHVDHVFAEEDPLVASALGVDAAEPRNLMDAAAAAAAAGNVTEPTDPVILGRKLYASSQLVTNMRDVSTVLNAWASTSPAVVANMLNPPPGAPPTVNEDVLINGCNSGVRISRAIGDYLLLQNGLFAAYSFLATPTGFPPTLSDTGLCTHLTSGIGSLYVYQLACQQWSSGNGMGKSVDFPTVLPPEVVCSGPVKFDATWTPSGCLTMLGNIRAANMTNVFFSPYNTTLSTGADPTVLVNDAPTTNVVQTTSTNATVAPVGVAPALKPDQETALRLLPHAAAVSFYTQAADLRSLCVQFGIVNTLISASSTTSGTGTTGTGSVTTADSGVYHASGPLFGLIALGSLGFFYLLQMLIFATVVGSKGAIANIRARLFDPAQATSPSPTLPLYPSGHPSKGAQSNKLPVMPARV